MVHHPTSKYFVLNDKIHALIDAGVLTLKSEQKKVTASMVCLNFETFPKVTVHKGLTPIPGVRLNVINPMVEKQEAKSLVPLAIKSGEIIWVHPDIVKDEQWESNKPKLKGKSCNVIFLATDEDTATIASFSDSEEEEKLSLMTQPAVS